MIPNGNFAGNIIRPHCKKPNYGRFSRPNNCIATTHNTRSTDHCIDNLDVHVRRVESFVSTDARTDRKLIETSCRSNKPVWWCGTISCVYLFCKADRSFYNPVTFSGRIRISNMIIIHHIPAESFAHLGTHRYIYRDTDSRSAAVLTTAKVEGRTCFGPGKKSIDCRKLPWRRGNERS